MGMYYAIFLTPISSDTTLTVDATMQLLEWLIEIEGVEISTRPIEIFEVDTEEDLEFYTLDELKNYLETNQNWDVTLHTSYWNKEGRLGPLSALFELAGVDEESGEWSSSLDSIEIAQSNLEMFEWGMCDESKTDRKFAIILKSDMKAGHPIDEAERYFALIWPKLSSSTLLETIENILNTKLEAQPYFY
jgi:hypothetical protein